VPDAARFERIAVCSSSAGWHPSYPLLVLLVRDSARRLSLLKVPPESDDLKRLARARDVLQKMRHCVLVGEVVVVIPREFATVRLEQSECSLQSHFAHPLAIVRRTA
jgi:hypothetical protein